jgi:hypothetical protein
MLAVGDLNDAADALSREAGCVAEDLPAFRFLELRHA